MIPASILANTNIIPQDGKLILEGGILEIKEDYTIQTFVTNDLFDFTEWVKKYVEDSHCSDPLEMPVVEYGDEKISLRAEHIAMDPRTDFPIAECALQSHPRLELLRKIENVWMDIDVFEELLVTLRENMASASCKDLIDHLRDFKMTKVTNIVRQKDPRTGDFTYSCSRVTPNTNRELGVNEFEPPRSVLFNVPVFEGSADRSDFEFDFLFDYNMDTGTAKLKFKLKNIVLGEKIKNARKAIVKIHVDTIGLPAFWGARMIKTMTDSWKYQKNGL